jgi:hypothetical protein
MNGRRPFARIARHVGAVTVACSALALASSNALADELQDHVDHAAALAQGERYKEALAELEATYAQRQSPRLLYMMAKMQQRLGDAQAAISSYERFLAADPDADPRFRSDAQEQVGKLRHLLGKDSPPPHPVAPPAASVGTDSKLETPPPEVHYEMKPHQGLMIGGAVTFGLGYLGAVITASVAFTTTTSTTCYNPPTYSPAPCPDNGNVHVGAGTLLIPVAGPFIASLAYRDPPWSIPLALIDGVSQIGGVVMMAYAAKHPKQVPVTGQRFQVLPYAGAKGGGLQAIGRF